MQDSANNNQQAANSEYQRDGGAGNHAVDSGDQHQEYSTGYRGGRGRGRGRGRSFFSDNWRNEDAGGAGGAGDAAGGDEEGGFQRHRGGRGGRGGGGRHFQNRDPADGEDATNQRHYDPDERGYGGRGGGGRGRGRAGRYQDRSLGGEDGAAPAQEDGTEPRYNNDEEGGYRGGRGHRGGRGGQRGGAGGRGGFRNDWRGNPNNGDESGAAADGQGEYQNQGYRGGHGRGGYRGGAGGERQPHAQQHQQSGEEGHREAPGVAPAYGAAQEAAAPQAAPAPMQARSVPVVAPASADNAAAPAATATPPPSTNAWASRRVNNNAAAPAPAPAPANNAAPNNSGYGNNNGNNNGNNAQRYGDDANAGGAPRRTQRPPHLRNNCRNEEEVLNLFTHHHKQKGVSLDNYGNIPVELVPNDVDPVTSFLGLETEPALAENIARCGYENPTPVQRYGIPVVLAGHDLMACAQTGSGKTAAFLIPVVQYVLKYGVSPAKNRVAMPIGLVLAPTRELALQIYDEVRKLTFHTDVFYDVCYGGTPYPTRFDNDILVACPGRLKDIFDRGTVSFRNTKFLILDEADRMLEMGFEEQIEYLVASRYTDMPVSDDRQTLMFSATFPQRILNLAKRYLRKRYYLLTVGRVGSTTKNITQTIERVEDSDKMDRLFELIFEHKKTDLVLVFVETKRLADDLFRELRKEGIPSSTIHGDRRQQDREAALAEFKSREKPILVATDVASRGLDIPDVMHVIQYDLPQEMDDYTHRIGRTGRAGNKGVATSFYSSRNNSRLAIDLYKYLREHEQDVPQWFKNEAERLEGEGLLARESGGGGRRRGGGGGGGGGRGGGRRDEEPEDSSTWGERGGGGRGGGGGASGSRGAGGGRAQAFAAKKEAKSAAAFDMDDGGF